MLDHPRIQVELGVDFFSRREHFERQAKFVVYTGKIDSYFDCQFGRLAYRSLRFVDERHTGWVQPVAMMNYADAEVPFTRQVEHKHFEPTGVSTTIVTREYPEEHTPENEPYYPVRDVGNVRLFNEYLRLTRDTRVIFGGRLGSYRYFNMDQVIAQAMKKAGEHLGISGAAARPAASAK
jgi:UDP-galactopyranose mutase